MKQRLLRPTAALFPIVGIAGILCGRAETVRSFFLYYYLLRIFTLDTVGCFRNGAAREPGVRRVDRRFSGSLLPLLIGGICVYMVVPIFLPNIYENIHAVGQYTDVAAGLVTTEHLFEERTYALGRRVDGVILSCVTNGLLLLALLLYRESPQAANVPYLLLGAGLGVIISVATSFAIEPMHGFSLKPIDLRELGSSSPQTFLYPLVALLVGYLACHRGFRGDVLFPFLYGLIPWRLARTPARRSADESYPLNLLLISIAATTAAAAAWCPALWPCAIAATIALLCGVCVYCMPSWRLLKGIALVIAALIPFFFPYCNALLAIVAIDLNLKNALRRKI